ncbi:MAG: 50S ribosomal protein L24 [Thermoplasmata archaeon]|nr:MAG: 50S ribosomal protein L24 [Thermoplasmata archaeon]
MMSTTSSKPRKQHKAQANLPLHRGSKFIRAKLDPAKFGSSGVKRITLRAGDTVKVVRGSRSGHEGKVARIDLKKRKVTIEKALITKADNKEVPIWFDASNLIVTKVDLSDAIRKQRFRSLANE